MRDTISTVSRMYLIAATWFVVLLATALGSLSLLGPVYGAFEASGELRFVLTMGLALTLATMVGAFMWMRLIGRRESAASHVAEAPRPETLVGQGSTSRP